jgi:FkbM family methyltransferase|tara:strand:+ start:46 stop:693 length:648 start_codon:yes stop_codon:yes gene_type:complete
MTHSQYGQDDFVMKYYSGKTNGYFVDVGAFNTGDDTIILENSGWSGICIEPINGAFSELSKNRNCVCLNICVGSENKEVDFLENTSQKPDEKWYGYTSALSGVYESYSPEHLDRIAQENKKWNAKSNLVKKQMLTLEKVFEQSNSPNFIEYLKIDVEGGELSCLKGVNFEKQNFGLISLEANYDHEINACVDYLKTKNYEPFVKVGIDVFFRKKL